LWLNLSGANFLNPVNVTLHRRQVLISVGSDDDVVLDSDSSDRFVSLQDFVIYMLGFPDCGEEVRREIDSWLDGL